MTTDNPPPDDMVTGYVVNTGTEILPQGAYTYVDLIGDDGHIRRVYTGMVVVDHE